jgi:hypothetical protein
MRFRIRKAQIRDDLRQHFELFGEAVVALALGLGAMQGGGGFGPPTAPTNAMMTVFQNQAAAAQMVTRKARSSGMARRSGRFAERGVSLQSAAPRVRLARRKTVAGDFQHFNPLLHRLSPRNEAIPRNRRR